MPSIPASPLRPAVLVQVDLDSLWAIRRVYGLGESRADLEDDPLYALGFARFLDLFAERGVRATFFAIGRDAEVPAKAALLRRAAEAGHEVANHSQTHPLGIGALAPGALDAEIARASGAIAAATGTRPAGFRAPGYDASPAVVQAVARAGLLYDSSLLPTSTGPLLRAAAGLLKRRGGARAPEGGRASSAPAGPGSGIATDPGAGGGSGHYGSGPVWRAPRLPYLASLATPWRVAAPGAPALLEVPVAVTARLRLPVHASVAAAAGPAWAHRAVDRLASQGGPLVYVFHAIDLVGADETDRLPAHGALARLVFGRNAAQRRQFVSGLLDALLSRCAALTTREFAEAYSVRDSESSHG